MKIYFKNKKLKKIFDSEKELIKYYGKDLAKNIKIRMKVLQSATNLEEISWQKPERRHQLKGNRKNQFAVDLYQPYRLIFTPDGEDIFDLDGNYDLKKITAIIILSVEDYHE